MDGFGTELEAIRFPLLGNSLVVGLFSLLHITLAAPSVAFMLLAPWLEWRGRTNPFDLDLSRTLTRFTIVVFSVSTVLAVIMLDLMIGLFPVTTMWMWNQFRLPIWFGMGAFFLQLLLLYPYYHFWERLRGYSHRLHVTLGGSAAFLMLCWVFMLDGMGSYMLTPVSEEGAWADLLNDTWLPLVLHRMGGNFVIAGFVIAAYGAWRAGRSQDQEVRPYYLHLFKTGWVIGLASLLLQPLTGWLYATLFRRAAPGAYEQLIQGPYQPFVYVQFILIGLLFLGNYLLIRSAGPALPTTRWYDAGMVASTLLMVASVGSPPMRRLFLFLLIGVTVWYLIARGGTYFRAIDGSSALFRPLALGIGLLSILTYLTMGTIRETSRRPDTVRGRISLQDELRQPAADRGPSGISDPGHFDAGRN